MTLRTAKLLGRAYSDSGSVSLDIAWNGADAWSGTVLTHALDQRPLDAMTGRDFLCEWHFPMHVHGEVPIRISVTGGEFWWQAVWFNHAFLNHTQELKLVTTWPAYQPSSGREAIDDFRILSEAEFSSKYGEAALDNFERRVVTASEENFSSNFELLSNPQVDTDGKNNVRIDGVAQHMDLALRSQGALGDWLWRVNHGQIIEADVLVAPPTHD